jgi:formylglycine-generating enzyme required for sulfatase activity
MSRQAIGHVIWCLLMAGTCRFSQAQPVDPLAPPPYVPPAPVVRDVAEELGMEFVEIPAGSFMMGSPTTDPDADYDEPQEWITLSSFELMSTEVTQGTWEEVMGTTVFDQLSQSSFAMYEMGFGTGDEYPMYCVSWNDCQEFISEMNRLDPDHIYRLPSEAEWEYACRAGTTTRFYWGDDLDFSLIDQYAWYDANTIDAQPVGQKLPNAWGLYDMSGSVTEWCDLGEDFWSCPMRGGNCWSDPEELRSAARERTDADSRLFYMGFRLARAAR